MFLTDETGPYDIRTKPHRLTERVNPQDLPAAILGDVLPESCKPESRTHTELALQIESTWNTYLNDCSAAGLNGGPDGFRDQEYSHSYRCILFAMPDLIKDQISMSRLYKYDILYRENGTYSLICRHDLYSDSGIFPTFEASSKWELDAARAQALQDITDWADFAEIPTWNLEEYFGFDGETAYFYGSKERHLISMWESDRERYGIYRIRTAPERLTASLAKQ